MLTQNPWLQLPTSSTPASPATRVQPSEPVRLPSEHWRMLAKRRGLEELPKGLDILWDHGVEYWKRWQHRQSYYLHQAAQVVKHEAAYAALSEPELRERVQEYRAIFRRGRADDAALYQATALIREVSARIRAEKHYPVQIAGGLAIYAGCVAEMATGEGKTLTAVIPAVLAGWRGRGCHVVTVNDYLAQRDAEQMRRIYEYCGLSVASINQESTPEQRRKAYAADITYLTNKEVCADYLRDCLLKIHRQGIWPTLLARSGQSAGSGAVQRGLDFAIVDEADSVLIDEAAVPLIISGDAGNDLQQTQTYAQAAGLAQCLRVGQDYTLDRRYSEVEITPAGHQRIAELCAAMPGLWQAHRRREELLVQAITAREFYLRDKQYVIMPIKGQDRVVIVDEATGRLMPERTWRDGLHQAIEAKENLPIQPLKETLARVSFQRFFRLYRKMGGMSGTALEARTELWLVYRRPVVAIPRHRPLRLVRHRDSIFKTAPDRWAAVVAEIARIHATGQPILVGTRSVEHSEHLSRMLHAQGLEHKVLNAIRHAEEAHIIAQSGQRHHITIATNMAGRGTDIKLGKGVEALGGLHVIMTERHDSARVDRQLFGRAARQGELGAAHAFVSLQDELLIKNCPLVLQPVRTLMARLLPAGRPTRLGLVRGLFRVAQWRAQKRALAQRKNVLRSDLWLDESLGFAGVD
ncbi:MAG: DEAD/DEAH box helicase [Phycisphaerae bacterium]